MTRIDQSDFVIIIPESGCPLSFCVLPRAGIYFSDVWETGVGLATLHTDDGYPFKNPPR